MVWGQKNNIIMNCPYQQFLKNLKHAKLQHKIVIKDRYMI